MLLNKQAGSPNNFRLLASSDTISIVQRGHLKYQNNNNRKWVTIVNAEYA